MHKLIFTWMIILCCGEAAAQVRSTLMVDRGYSFKVGASNLLAVRRGVCLLESRFMKSRWFPEDSPGKKAAGMTYRLTKTVLVDNVVDHLAILIQHEVFGHGSRFREFGYSGSSYSLNLVPPYGSGRGTAYFGRSDPNRSETVHEEIAMRSGGSEANAVLAKSVLMKWMRCGQIPARETLLYLFAANDLSWYILRTRLGRNIRSGNDVNNFLRLVNRSEGYPFQNDYRLTLGSLAKQNAIHFLDPFQYVSLFTYLVTYVWSGEEERGLPMLRIGNIGYMPSFRLGLAPWGSEAYFENYVATSQRVVNFYFRRGFGTFHRFGGFGVQAISLMQSRRFSLDSGVDLWHQPRLLLGGTEAKSTRGGMGVALSGTCYYRLSQKKPVIDLTVEMGYKTAGFLQGEQLRSGWIGRVGIGFVEM